MAHFESDAEVYDQLGGILNNLVGNATRLEQLRQADAVVQFAFRQPEATVTLDVRAGRQARVDLGATQLTPDVVLAMDADTGHALLHGELSPTVALARGDVRTKGPVAKVLRLVPATVGAHEVEPTEVQEPAPPPVHAAPGQDAPAEETPDEQPPAPEALREAEAHAGEAAGEPAGEPEAPVSEAEAPAAEAPAEAPAAEAPAAEAPGEAPGEAPAEGESPGA